MVTIPLFEGKYELMTAIPADAVPAALLPEGEEMVWLEGVGLGIGCLRNELNAWEREWLYWYDRHGVRYPTAQERAAKAEAIADRERLEKLQEKQQKEKLAAYLRSLGINPDEIPDEI